MAEKKTTTTTKKRTYTKRTESAAPAAEKAVKAEEVKTEEMPAARTYTEAELQEIVARAVAQAQANARPQIVQIAQETEKVHFLWLAEVSDDNVVTFGDGGMYGRITGKVGTFYVPKSDVSRILDSMNRYFLKKRWLIVLSGLNDEEREGLGVDYKEGEILDRKAFQNMLSLGDDIIPIYMELCDGHKEMVAKRYYEAFKDGKPMSRERIVALKDASGNCESAAVAFRTIVEQMNARDAR